MNESRRRGDNPVSSGRQRSTGPSVGEQHKQPRYCPRSIFGTEHALGLHGNSNMPTTTKATPTSGVTVTETNLAMATPNRWLIAVAGVLMQVAFGAVYAWSVFRIPLSQARGWTIPEVTAGFEVAIFVVGLAALAGG